MWTLHHGCGRASCRPDPIGGRPSFRPSGAYGRGDVAPPSIRYSLAGQYGGGAGTGDEDRVPTSPDGARSTAGFLPAGAINSLAGAINSLAGVINSLAGAINSLAGAINSLAGAIKRPP